MLFPHVILGKDGDQYGDQVTKLLPVGQKMSLPDGRIFRYAKNTGAAGVANKLYQSSVSDAGWTAEAITVAIAIGDNNAQLTDSGNPVTDADEGSIVLEETDDLGHIYFIDHQQPVTGANTPVFFKPGVVAQFAVAVVALNVTSFLKNPWQDIILMPSPPTAIPCGVMCSVIADGAWGWVQTMGVCSCVIDGTVVVGECVRPSEDDNGAVAAADYDEADVADHGTIGRVVEVAPDQDFGLIYLRME